MTVVLIMIEDNDAYDNYYGIVMTVMRKVKMVRRISLLLLLQKLSFSVWPKRLELYGLQPTFHYSVFRTVVKGVVLIRNKSGGYLIQIV